MVTAPIVISSFNLLKTFAEANRMTAKELMSKLVIQMAFMFSALLLACIDRLTSVALHPKRHEEEN